MANLRYRIDPVDLNGHRYGVTIFIPKSLTSSPLKLQLPSWIPGSYMIRDFSKHLESLTVKQSHSKNKPSAVKKLDSHTWEITADRKSTRLNSSHSQQSRMPSSA